MMNYYFIFIFMFMIYSFMFIMILPSSLYKFHPLILSLLLIFYTLILCFKMNFLKSDYWYSYILFLMMIGGLMILFMYFTSLTTMNQLFYYNLDIYFYLKLIMLVMMFILDKEMMMYFMDSMNFEVFNFNNLNLKLEKFNFKNLLMDYYMSITLFAVIYMFMLMICCVLICLKFFLPLRQLIKI